MIEKAYPAFEKKILELIRASRTKDVPESPGDNSPMTTNSNSGKIKKASRIRKARK